MSETQTEETPPKKSKLPLIIGLVLMILAGGGGFFALYTGMLFGAPKPDAQAAEKKPDALPDIAFIPLDPMVISIKTPGARHLRFTAQLEVAGPYAKEVEMLRPRVMDVLNSYLRAVDLADIEAPTSLVRLKAQMLRRVQIVTGEGRVRDLLVMEFVVN